MKKNVIKVLSIALFAVILCTVFSTICLADEKETFSYANISEKTVTANASDNSGAAASVNRLIGSALTIVQVVGSGVAVIMLIVLAIKYISAAPSDKAEIKKHAVVYVVGAIVLFAASGIIGIVRNFAGNVRAEGSDDSGYNANA